MKSLVLQDWITVRSAGNNPTPPGPNFVQDSAGWLDLSIFQDVVFWFDLRQSTAPGAGGTLTWQFQTSPTKDELFFQSMASSTPFGTIPTRVLSVIPILMGNAMTGGTVALSRWVRWVIIPSPTTAAWNATFRVLVTANQVVAGASRVGESLALPTTRSSAGRMGVVVPSKSPSSVVSIQQSMPSGLGQGLGPSQSPISLVQPATSLGGVGGLGNIGP